jgi:hypothetical protein
MEVRPVFRSRGGGCGSGSGESFTAAATTPIAAATAATTTLVTTAPSAAHLHDSRHARPGHNRIDARQD